MQKKLKQKKSQYPESEKRIRLSEDLLWGIHPVVEALQQEPGRFNEIFLQKERHGQKVEELIELARSAHIKLSFVEQLRLTGEGASAVRHQGVVARLNEVVTADFADFVEKLKQRIANGLPTRIIICDSLQDPHNLGAIIRSALASGACGMVATRDRSAPLGGTAAKSSAGAISHLDITMVTNLAQALEVLKKAGLWIFGAVKDEDAQSIYEVEFNVPCAIVVGSEGKGIRPLIKKECDVMISIPMEGQLDSLNSSVAAAVILFEVMRQHGAANRVR